MDLEDISQLMKKILFEFPVCQVDFETPGWFDVLELSSPVKKAVIEFAQKVMNQISCMRDAKVPEKESLPQQISRFVLEETNLAQGKIVYEISLKEELYFSLASECAAFHLHRKSSSLMPCRVCQTSLSVSEGTVSNGISCSKGIRCCHAREKTDKYLRANSCAPRKQIWCQNEGNGSVNSYDTKYGRDRDCTYIVGSEQTGKRSSRLHESAAQKEQDGIWKHKHLRKINRADRRRWHER